MTAQKIYQGLVKRGQSPVVAIGLLANMQAESGLNPGINEIAPVVPGSRGGFGLNQWTGPRRRQFEAFAQSRGAQLDDLDTQLDFTVHELNSTERRAAEALARAQTPEEAARIVSDKFLRPGIPHLDKRIAAAQQFSSLLGGEYTPPSTDQMQSAGGQQMQRQGLLSQFVETKGEAPGFGDRLRRAAGDGSLWDGLALGLNTMRGSFADQGLAQTVGARMDRREAQAQANATAEWLRANGREDLAGAIEQGMISGGKAFEMMQGPGPIEGKVVGDNLVNPYTGELIGSYAPEPAQYQVITGETAAAYGLDPTKAYNVGPNNKIEAIGGGGVNVSVNNGSEVGTIPQGFELVTDPETGGRSMRPIPGGPEDQAKFEAARTSAAATATDIVSSAAQRAREAYGGLDMGASGVSLASYLPWTDSAELVRQNNVLKASATLENLNAMREQSPTGGALGNVTEGEGRMLADKSGALDPSSPNYLRDVDDYERTLFRVIHGKEQGDRLFEQSRNSGAGAAQTETDDDELLRMYGNG